MSFQPDASLIRWRLHLAAPPEVVYARLATDAGRASFWAESAVECAGAIDFVFPDNLTWRGEILEATPTQRFSVRYFGGSLTTFELAGDGAGGTDLVVTDANVPDADCAEVTAGWVSVLMALKAAVDFGVDLRNHNPHRTWAEGYAEN